MEPRPAAASRPSPWRWIVGLAALVLLLLAAWLAAGPWLAVRGIEQAIAARDTAALERHVDFPRLRASLQAQLEDRLVREAGEDVASHPLGMLALAAAGGVSRAAVETLVTPAGIGALLQGHAVWKRASGDTRGSGLQATPEPARPLREASHRYESLSRFSATVHHADGGETVFVLERQGLRWRLVDIRLPRELSAYMH